MPLKHTVEEITLKNGAKGLIIDVPDSTVVSYNIHFRAGNEYANPDVHQTAHLMEHLAFGSNEKFATAEEFSQEFKKNGAYSNAFTSDRDMNYVAAAAVMEFDRILDLMELSITKPKYKQEMLDTEKGNVREELTGNANDHSRVMWQRIWKSMGGKSLMDSEKIETLDRVKLSNIKEHHHKTHVLRNMRFTIAGDLLRHKDLIVKKLNGWDLPSGERLPVIKKTYKSSPVVHIHRKEMSNLTFAFNMVIHRELTRSERVSMGALVHILTGTFHSRIFGKARSMGICYGMGSGFYTDIAGTSGWNFHGRVGIDNAEALFRLIVSQLIKVVSGDISADELAAAKQYAIGGYQMRGQTVDALSGWYSSDYFDKEIIDPLELSPEYIKAITRNDMVKLAKEFINDSVWTLGGIGNITKQQMQAHYNQLAQLFENRVK